MPKTKKPRRGLRYWLQQLHLWTGLILMLPLVMMGITGSVLVYAHDIEHLLGQGEPPVTTPGEWRSPMELIAAAQAAHPDPRRIPIAVRWPSEIGEPAAVRLSRPGMAEEKTAMRHVSPAVPGQAQGVIPTVSPFAGSIQITLDPVTAQPLETQQAMTPWVRFFHDLHGHLFIPGGLGRQLVGWLGIAMLVLGCSGLVIWWPRNGQWKAAFTIRKGAKGLRLHRDLHGSVGIWSLLLFMLVNFTGVYLAFPQQIEAAVTAVFPSRDMRAVMFQARVEPLPGATPIGLAEGLALAQEAVPDGRFANAFLPTRPDQAMRISMTRGTPEAGVPNVGIIIDQWRGTLIDVFDPKTLSAGEAIIAWQRALHYGIGLGGLYKFLVFVSGIIVPLFAITGFFMWWIKRRNRRATELAKQEALRQVEQQRAAE